MKVSTIQCNIKKRLLILDVESSDTILMAKKKIQKQLRICACDQQLVNSENNQELTNDVPLAHCTLYKTSSIYLVVRPTSGRIYRKLCKTLVLDIQQIPNDQQEIRFEFEFHDTVNSVEQKIEREFGLATVNNKLQLLKSLEDATAIQGNTAQRKLFLSTCIMTRTAATSTFDKYGDSKRWRIYILKMFLIAIATVIVDTLLLVWLPSVIHAD